MSVFFNATRCLRRCSRRTSQSTKMTPFPPMVWLVHARAKWYWVHLHLCMRIFRLNEIVNYQPRSQGLSSPQPKGNEGGKTLVHASLVLVTNLFSWKGSQFFRILSPQAFVTSKTDPWQPWKALFRFRCEA